MRYMPAFLTKKCFKNKLRSQMYVKSYEKLSKELDILRLVQQIRAMKAAIKSTTRLEDWARIKRDTARRRIWFDVDILNDEEEDS